MRIYLAGPMSGWPDFNYPAFHQAAFELRERGFHVENPAETTNAPDAPWENHMRLDIQRMLTCDGVVLLPGWDSSKGARIEKRLAMELGMPVADLAVVLAFQAVPFNPNARAEAA